MNTLCVRVASCALFLLAWGIWSQGISAPRAIATPQASTVRRGTRGSPTKWEVVKGATTAWEIKEDSLVCHAAKEEDHWILSDSPLQGNWAFEAKLQLTGGDQRRQGLLFGVRAGSETGYLLDLGEPLRLWKFRGDQFIEVANWPLATSSSDHSTTLRVLKTGATYAFWLDGKLINTISNPSWQRTAKGATPGQEPDSGRYGFALAKNGIISKVRIRAIHLARKYDQNPVLPATGPKGSWEESQAFTAGVLENGNSFYLYYTGVDATDPKQEGGGYGRLGAATSHDLLHWTKYSANPLLGPGPAGAWDDNHLQFGPVTKTPDSRYAVTYQAWDPAVNRWHGIGIAFANGPLGPFEKYLKNPVLRPSPEPTEFDGDHIHLHSVLRVDDGTYAMLYTGFSSHYSGGRVGDKGGLATSKDLIHWQKYSSNPVFPLDELGAWDDGHVRPKGVARFRDWYYMFYEGAHYDGKVWFDQVGMARSKDLVHWERFPFNPIIPLDTASGRDTLVTEWPCAIVKDNKLYVLYWGGAPGDVAISIAEIPTDVLEGWGKQ